MTVHSTDDTSDAKPDPRPSVSLVFPVHNDGRSCERLTEKAVRILSERTSHFEIIIVNDASMDESGRVADELAARFDSVRVYHHPENRGYGPALRTGFSHLGETDWVCFTDGDNQYDIGEIRHFLTLLPQNDVVIGFRYRKTYGPIRRLMSLGLNVLVRLAFGTRLRDVTCGFKMVRRPILQSLPLISLHAFAGGEVAVRASLMGYRVTEAGISMYRREFGTSSIVSLRGIYQTALDVFRVRQDIFRNRPRPE